MLKYFADQYGERATQGDRSLYEFLKKESLRLDHLVVRYYNILI